MRSVFYYSVFFPIVEILSALSVGLIIWYGGEAIISGNDVTLGELIAFILYIYMMFRPIRQLADRFNVLQMGIVGSERVFKVLDTKDFISDNGLLKNDKIRGVFKLKEASKRSQREILFNHNLIIEIEGIEKHAIVWEWLNLSVIND